MSHSRVLSLLAASVVLALLLTLALAAGPARGAPEPLPPQGSPPPGANDYACKPPARHPYPVVLVHGTYLNQTGSWTALAPALTRLGYCVFALDYGNSPITGVNAVGDIPTSARQLDTFVGDVLSATGAKKVSFVGHSQGGMMPRYFIKFLEGSNRVDDLIGLSPSNHGTDNPLAGPAGANGCPACGQQVAGSPFITELNAGDETPAPVSYTVIQTNKDEVVTPFESAFLPAAGDRVTNVLLQDKCPAVQTEHVGMTYDPVAIQWALSALGRPGPADPGFEPDCTGAALATFPDSDSVPDPDRGGGGNGSADGNGTAGANAPKLVIGHVPRRAATTRKRRLRLAVASRHAPMQRLVVTIRAAKSGRKLGASLPRGLSGRKAVVVRLKRALRRGRYRAVAVGRDRNNKRYVARRTFRLR
jgi:triacylglycerol lipase